MSLLQHIVKFHIMIEDTHSNKRKDYLVEK